MRLYKHLMELGNSSCFGGRCFTLNVVRYLSLIHKGVALKWARLTLFVRADGPGLTRAILAPPVPLPHFVRWWPGSSCYTTQHIFVCLILLILSREYQTKQMANLLKHGRDKRQFAEGYCTSVPSSFFADEYECWMKQIDRSIVSERNQALVRGKAFSLVGHWLNDILSHCSYQINCRSKEYTETYRSTLCIFLVISLSQNTPMIGPE